MPNIPNCPDCEVIMEAGFVPDFQPNYLGKVQNCWHPGSSEPLKVLGMQTGTGKIKQSALIKITAYRCPKCGLLRQYAHN